MLISRILKLLCVMACSMPSIAFNQVIVVNNKLVSKNAILKIINESSDPDDLCAIKHKLMESGLFNSIKIKKQQDDIIITVEEASIINHIKWSGSKLLDKEKYEKLTGFKVGAKFNARLAQQATCKLQESFLTQNIFVQVEYKTQQIDASNLALEVKITDSVPAMISSIEILGLNTHELTAKALLRQCPTIQRSMMEFAYLTQEIDKYKTKMITYAQSLGYYNFKIVSHYLKPLSTKDYKLFITCIPGIKHHKKEVQITNTINPALTEKFAQIIKKTYTSKAINITQIEQAIKQAVVLFEAKGHNVKIEYKVHNLSQDANAKTVYCNVEFIVHKITPMILNNITVVGNKIGNRDMILNVSKLSPGQNLTADKLKKAKNRLLSTGFFKQIDFNIENQKDGLADLQIKCVEQQTIHLTAGLQMAYGGNINSNAQDESNIHYGFTAGYMTPNFLGLGYNINTQFSWMTGTTDLNLSFSQPVVVNVRNIGWGVGCGGKYVVNSRKYTHSISNDYPTSFLIKDFDSTLPNHDRSIQLDWTRARGNINTYILFGISNNLTVGIKPTFYYQKMNLDSSQTFPRIFNDNLCLKNNGYLDLSLPLIYDQLNYSNNRTIGFSASLTPSVNSNTFALLAAISFNTTLPGDYDKLTDLSLKIEGGVIKSWKDDHKWDFNYRSSNLLLGISTAGARELTTFMPLGGREFLAAKLRLVLPLSFLTDKIRAYGFIAAGTIGNCGIPAQTIDETTCENMGFKPGTQDIVNDKHSLRVTAGVGALICLTDQTVITVGYNHPIVYNEEFDRITTFNINMSTSIDN